MVVSFSHQIQSEYYGYNILVSIGVIALENSSSTHQTSTFFASGMFHVMLCFTHLFLMIENIILQPQLHTAKIIELLKNRQLLFCDISTI